MFGSWLSLVGCREENAGRMQGVEGVEWI